MDENKPLTKEDIKASRERILKLAADITELCDESGLDSNEIGCAVGISGNLRYRRSAFC